MNKRILLVEDEEGLIITITDCLQNEGYQVEPVTDGETGLRRATEVNYDLLILDVMLPKKNGFDLLRDLRQQGIRTPAIMLTARRQVVDRILGLKLGADDYLTKPFEMGELLARMEAIIRRVPAAHQPSLNTYVFGKVKVDFRLAEVTRDGQVADLAVREYQLLRYFIEHRNTVISRDELLNEVWGYDAMPITRTVDVHVSALRQKLEDNSRCPQFFLTVHGIGYKFIG